MPSRPRRRLTLVVLALVPGVLAAAFVVVTLVLIAMKGHPEGLLAIIVGVAIPVVLRGAGRLARLARSSLRSAREARSSSDVSPPGQAQLDPEPDEPGHSCPLVRDDQVTAFPQLRFDEPMKSNRAGCSTAGNRCLNLGG